MTRTLAIVVLAALCACNGGSAASPPFPAPSAPRTLAGAITEFSVTPGSRPTGIAAGPDGNLWFTENMARRIGRITPAGVFTEFSQGISAKTAGGLGLLGIAAGPDGNLWFVESGGGFDVDRIGRITPAGVVTEFASGITGDAGPHGIAAGPDGNLWFTESRASRIGRITPAGVITEFANGITPGASPYNIAAGPDGNLWFTEIDPSTSRIGRITPAGVVTEFAVGPLGSLLDGIAAGPDGNMWFTDAANSYIGRITPAGAVTKFSSGLTPGGFDPFTGGLNQPHPAGITAGPDGNLWFTETGTDRIGRITPAGVITEFQSGITRNSAPEAIVTGPDGNVWFSEPTFAQIGRLQ